MHAPDAMGWGRHAAATPAAPRIWGRALLDLHDEFWAAAGVTVVRPGGTAVGASPEKGDALAGRATASTAATRRPRRSRHGSRRQAGRGWRHATPIFLLLGLDELAAFAPRAAILQLGGRRRATMVIELLTDGVADYTERVESDHSDGLVAVRREYTPQGTDRVLLTRDRRIATWWQQSVHPARHPRARTAVDAVTGQGGANDPRGGRGARGAGGLRRRRVLQETSLGRLENGHDRTESLRWLQAMMRLQPDLAGMIDGVHGREPDVWVHETARIGANVALAGPLWIGANVVLDGHTAAVGPDVMIDADAPFAIAAPDRETTGPDTAERGTGEAARRGVSQPARPAATRRRPAVERLTVDRAAHRAEHWSVRAFNMTVASIVLLLLLPIVPLVMLAIWIEDGRPFFFGHVRQTRGGRNFTCWKFRTMCRDAEALKTQLEDANVCDGPQFHIADDPRLLRIGRLLRRFHIDELPQFWNVLTGDMNIVGPRPSPDDENQFCPAWREARLSVKPGLTGLWQIRRTRAPMADFQEWIRWDLEYVARRSWRLDLWIMWRTAWGMVRGEGDASPALGGSAQDPLATLTGFQPPLAGVRSMEAIGAEPGATNAQAVDAARDAARAKVIAATTIEPKPGVGTETGDATQGASAASAASTVSSEALALFVASGQTADGAPDVGASADDATPAATAAPPNGVDSAEPGDPAEPTQPAEPAAASDSTDASAPDHRSTANAAPPSASESNTAESSAAGPNSGDPSALDSSVTKSNDAPTGGTATPPRGAIEDKPPALRLRAAKRARDTAEPKPEPGAAREPSPRPVNGDVDGAHGADSIGEAGIGEEGPTRDDASPRGRDADAAGEDRSAA